MKLKQVQAVSFAEFSDQDRSWIGLGFIIYLFSDTQTHKGIHYISEITGGFKLML